jgi:hypothetical protein
VSAAFGGRILDAGAVLDHAIGATAYGPAVRDAALREGITLAVPAAALAAAWSRAAPFGRLLLDGLLDLPVIVVDPLDTSTARSVGSVVTGGRGSLELGHVVLAARARGWPVITAEAQALLALAPDVEVEPLP